MGLCIYAYNARKGEDNAAAGTAHGGKRTDNRRICGVRVRIMVVRVLITLLRVLMMAVRVLITLLRVLMMAVRVLITLLRVLMMAVRALITLLKGRITVECTCGALSEAGVAKGLYATASAARGSGKRARADLRAWMPVYGMPVYECICICMQHIHVCI